MNKLEVLDYIKKHNKEYGGKLVTEKGFKKHFEELYNILQSMTFPSYSEKWDFKQKLWHFLRDDYTQHLCKCGGVLKFRSFWFGYNEYCKANCPSMIENQVKCVKEKNKLKTKEEKDKIQEKVRNTFLKKYGVERYSQTKEWKEKTIQKNLEKYGQDWYTKTDEYKIRYEQHCEKKYGTGIKNSFQDENVKKQIRKKFYDNFLKNHPNVIEVKDNTLICKCTDSNCTLCQEKIYEIDKTTFSDRNYYHIDTCTKRTTPQNLSSGIEKKLYNYIKSIYDGVIIENERSILNGKEIDIYLPELKLGFEFNGVYWHSEIYKDKKYHQEKSLNCLDKGIQLIQIWEDDWIFRNEIVKDFILSKLGKTPINIGARKCIIKDVSNSEAYHFLQTNHIQGGVKNGYNIGLYYNNELVEVMTFGGLRKSMGSNPISGHYEIYRVCSKLGYNIQGGFSKLLKHFENTYKPIQIITYANLDYTYGNVYNKTGFHKDKISKPTYTWVVNGQRKHRTNFRKSKLKECIDNPDLTEIEVMYNRNCWRCWDSGKIKFIKNY